MDGTPRPLDLNEIVDAARTQTGLDTLGEPDILEGLGVLIESLNTEANLRPDGVEAQRASLTGVVANRLRIDDLFRRHPEILDEEIRAPIVITGLPRTGTTKLHRMMAAGPFQSIPLYKLLFPAPLGSPPPGGEDLRITLAEQVSARMRDVFPDFFVGHPMLPREADEEIWMLDLVTRGWMPCYIGTVPSYRAWSDRQDLDTWYAFLRRLLQMFQWLDGSPSTPWLLKSPEHLLDLRLVFDTFPDATVAQTHRDPVVAITSIAVLAVASRRMYTDTPDPEEAGQYALQHWSGALGGMVEQREKLEQSHRIVDVPYRDIVGDVMPLIDRITAAAGIELTDEARAVMRQWETDNPQGKHGRHRYALETVGLTEAEVRSAFEPYYERFGHLIE